MILLFKLMLISLARIHLRAVNFYQEWLEDNCMPCNVTKCNELCIRKRCKENYSPDNDTKLVESLKLLGITFQNNSMFTVHIKNKLLEANKCLFVIKSLKKEGFCQDDIDHLFINAMVLPKLTNGLSVYAASKPELTTVQKFLCRCYKRKYIWYCIL